MGPVLVPTLAAPTLPPQEPAPPLAVQAVALVVVHVSDTDCPTCMVLGFAAKLTTAAAGGVGLVTVTVTDRGALVPPGPVHSSVNT
jgi:hypothetical protein